MGSGIKLSGGEITVLKTIGLSGSQVPGSHLVDKSEDMEKAELLEVLCDLMAQGYVVANKVNVRSVEDMERAIFRVNPAHSRDLRDAITPSKSRDESRARRQRRS